MQNQRAVSLLGLHGRGIEEISVHSMRASRAFCAQLTVCSRLQKLDLRGVWKSPAINNGLVNAIVSLPLRILLFGKNEIGSTGFHKLCQSLAGSLEEFDFNSTTLPQRAYYNIVKLRKLKSLTLRCCTQVEASIVPFLATLNSLRSLQLSFCSKLSGTAIFPISTSALSEQLETLVLNGMYLHDNHFAALGKLRRLQTLSVCHPMIDSGALQELFLPELKLFTIFCSKYLDSFQFVRNLPKLEMLCLYRCAISVESMHEVAKACPNTDFKIFMPRKVNTFGVAVKDSELEIENHRNISHLSIMSRPYPFI
jgi:hypothetical protein